MKINEYKKSSKNQTRMNVADIAEVLLQRIDKLEVYCRRMEEATEREMKIDTREMDALRNDFKTLLNAFEKQGMEIYPLAVDRLKNGLNEVIGDGERRLRQSTANRLNGSGYTRLWVISFFVSLVFIGVTCFTAIKLNEQGRRQEVYREFILSSPKTIQQFNEWIDGK